MFSFLLGHMRFYVRLGLSKRASESSCMLNWSRLPVPTSMLYMSIKDSWELHYNTLTGD